MKKTSATSRKVKAAFEEVHENTPKIVKHTARKYGRARAESQRTAIALSKARSAGAKIPGPNFVSDDALHTYSGTASGVSHAGERVMYKKNVSPDCATVAPVTGAEGYVESARQKNNRTRDARTNLGRGKPAHVEVA